MLYDEIYSRISEVSEYHLRKMDVSNACENCCEQTCWFDWVLGAYLCSEDCLVEYCKNENSKVRKRFQRRYYKHD